MAKKKKQKKDLPHWLKKDVEDVEVDPHQGDRGEAKRGGKKPNSESANIVNYIKSISEKNYAKANKYLHAAIEDKMRDKIKNTADKMEF